MPKSERGCSGIERSGRQGCYFTQNSFELNWVKIPLWVGRRLPKIRRIESELEWVRMVVGAGRGKVLHVGLCQGVWEKGLFVGDMRRLIKARPC